MYSTLNRIIKIQTKSHFIFKLFMILSEEFYLLKIYYCAKLSARNFYSMIGNF